jgi:hypothetical protein
LSSYFGDIVLIRRASFVLKIYDDNKITELKLCLMCIDDSFFIFLFPLHMFLVNNFSVKLFSDNSYGFNIRSLGSNFQI